MKYMVLVLACFLCAGHSIAVNDGKLDMSDTFLSLLEVNSNSLSKVSVKQVISNKVPLTHNKECDIAVYKIFGSILNEFNVLQKRYALVKVYNGNTITRDTIMSSKEYLQAIICDYPDEQVKSMAYVSLGVAFYEDSDVALFLLGRFLNENTPKEEKGLILEALSYCFDNKNDIIANTVFKICLRSHDEELRGYVATILVENNLCRKRFLPDLISSAITAEPMSDFSQKLSTALHSYDTELLRQYRSILREAIKSYPENKLLASLYTKTEEKE